MSRTRYTSNVRLTCFLILYLANCWLWMQGVHEFGHVIGAVVSGGHVKCIVWHIATISRTDVAPNPHPLLVCWAGPVLGGLLPFCLHLFAWRNSKLSAFFVGFCFVANGAYISIGSIDQIGDAGELLRLGSEIWQLWLTGLIAIMLGLGIWHRMGRLEELKHWSVSRPAMTIQATLLAITLIIQLLLFPKP